MMNKRHPYLDMDMETRNAYLNLSNRIAVYRKMRGMTQRELSEALGISMARLSGCECGARTVSIQLAFAAADFFGVTVNALLGLPSHEELLELKSPDVNIPDDCELQVDEHYSEIPRAEKAKTYRFPCVNIMRLRGAANMIMATIAKRVNRSISVINVWEKGITPPPLPLAVELSIFFGVTLNQLMGVPETARPKQSHYLQNWENALPEEVLRWGGEEEELVRERAANGNLPLDAAELFLPFQVTRPENLKVVFLVLRPWAEMKDHGAFPKQLVRGVCREYGITEEPERVSARLSDEGVMCLPIDFEQMLGAQEAQSSVRRKANRFVVRVVQVCSSMPTPIVFVYFGDIVRQAMEKYMVDIGDKKNAVLPQRDFRSANPDADLFHHINELLAEMGGEPVRWQSD